MELTSYYTGLLLVVASSISQTQQAVVRRLEARNTETCVLDYVTFINAGEVVMYSCNENFKLIGPRFAHCKGKNNLSPKQFPYCMKRERKGEKQFEPIIPAVTVFAAKQKLEILTIGELTQEEIPLKETGYGFNPAENITIKCDGCGKLYEQLLQKKQKTELS